MMERLTYRGSEIMTEDGWFKPSYSCYSTRKINERLAEYEDLEELGAYYNEQDFGKTVFLTKEEAEQKLKEMESD